MTLEALTFEAFWQHWRLYQKKTLEARRHWRPGDIGGLSFKRGWGKHPQEGNICLRKAFVKHVVREIYVWHLTGLRA